MKLNDFEKELLRNPEFRKEFNKFDLAFEIGEMLIEARIFKGMTQDKLAHMVGTKQSGIARAEAGKSLPSLSFLNKIAKALKTHLIIRFAFMNEDHVKVAEHPSTSSSTNSAHIFAPHTAPALITYSSSPSLAREHYENRRFAYD